MNTGLKSLSIAILVGLLCAGLSHAHFGMIIPSTDTVSKDDTKEVKLLLQFTHPFEGGPQMELPKPEKFGVVAGGKATDLLPTVREKKLDGKSAWETTYVVTRPADYVFFMQPKPYWESAEDKFIVHFTKVIVNGLGAEEGWDKPVGKAAGIPVEIVPLSRPYGLYAGNLFTGQVFRNGTPVSDAEIEIEYWGKGKSKAPTDSHVCQIVRADPNGIFSYAMPRAGWWGFSAIMEAAEPIAHEGKPKKVEIGAVIWVHAYPWNE